MRPVKLRINGGRITKETILPDRRMVLSWALEGGGQQSAYFVRVSRNAEMVFETGWVKSGEQNCVLTVPAMRSGFAYEITLSLRDEQGAESCADGNQVRLALQEAWGAPWIMPAEDFGDAVIYFARDFSLDQRKIDNAVLYLCGIGYHSAWLNGEPLSDYRMAPAFSDYQKRCYYEVLDISRLLKAGENQLRVDVAQGWRRNLGDYLKHVPGNTVSFFGRPQLTAILSLTFEDGSTCEIKTDDTWQCRKGNIVCAHLFDGEIYDARIGKMPAEPCVITEKPHPDTKMVPDTLEPIRVKKRYAPLSVHGAGGGYVFDLGQNIAGVVEISLPRLPEGTEITLQHAEVLDEKGDIYTDPLRGAKATDVYIAGKENPRVWSPTFTYHGFRYVKVTGLPDRPEKSFLQGLQFYTDIDAGSSFRCGSAVVNQLGEMIRMTERDNIHSIATDCPQRDERMGWLNDASVRFEGMPYHFDVGRLFPKIIDDIRDAQIDGAITCTAPYVFGYRPADPVSSSFLIAAYMCYLHYGNVDLIREAYPAMCAWNEHLARISEDGLIPLSYYGDWASPIDCCEGKVRSAITPGAFMSTGYHYMNAKLLACFAKILGKDSDAEKHIQRAEYVRSAMLAKWLAPDGKVATGSQACQAFALRLGIIPEDLRQKAAQIMHRAVLSAGTRLTTGNLCTMYLMEMLMEYGYVDTAWELLTREEYPSWGFMMQNGATTVWERFELKKDPGMNSHCHPMYGSVGKLLYSHIAGISPMEPGFRKILIRPHMPKKLLFAQATVDTCKGDVTVKWEKKYGKTDLLIDIPNGTEACVMLNGNTYDVTSGTQIFSFDNI